MSIGQIATVVVLAAVLVFVTWAVTTAPDMPDEPHKDETPDDEPLP